MCRHRHLSDPTTRCDGVVPPFKGNSLHSLGIHSPDIRAAKDKPRNRARQRLVTMRLMQNTLYLYTKTPLERAVLCVLEGRCCLLCCSARLMPFALSLEFDGVCVVCRVAKVELCGLSIPRGAINIFKPVPSPAQSRRAF